MQTTDPTTEELATTTPEDFPTDRLTFDGLRGAARLHLGKEELLEKIQALPSAPCDHGTLDLIVARTADFGRALPEQARLTSERGLPGDRWGEQSKYGSEFQLAVTRTDFARTIANGQPLELHGDNLFLSLDLSSDNLPILSLVRIGSCLLEVTPQEHNGCKKWVQRFGLAPMRLNMAAEFRKTHLRGIYLRVVEEGDVRVGDSVQVVRRGTADL
jgi:hypothetical protein